MEAVPERPTLDGLESTWSARWQESGIYRFDRAKSRAEIYAIDTPPPTISGHLHLGTAFGYIQVDAVARYRRMAGHEVFYPMGWDDNGLPTERRVQRHFGVRCDPALPYDPHLQVTPGGDGEIPVSRRNFVELCQRFTSEFEEDFEQQWRTLGLSVDWTLTYSTIGDRSRRTAQRAFLSNYRRGEAYASVAPTMWDVDFQTAVAQAEFEDRPVTGAFHRIAFPRAEGGTPVEIETTRPELLPACVALVAHPDDDRYKPLFGREVVVPVFGVGVPVLAHPLADPEKGSGIAMVCTFGDTADVVWWRELKLPTRVVITREGRFHETVPDWLDGAGAKAWAELGGSTVKQARRRVVELLRAAGNLIGEPRAIVHDVKFYEKGDRPLEIVASRQWYIRNGASDPALRSRLIERGRELVWHPDFMRTRYEHWVEGLNTDWLISRQRYFGVPFPVWYPVDEGGTPNWDAPILAEEDTLPIDPQTDVPPGYDESRRGAAGGFVGDPDVMDTWATSSLTPQIAGGWVDDDDLFGRVFPYDLRPQGPEIIRTWLFSTLLRSEYEHGQLPWANSLINGWILDPDRKKMSKSSGNVLTPMPLAATYGADALRYWSCRSGPGVDTSADDKQMKVGRRLALKVLNAGKFVLGLGVPPDADPAAVTHPLDRAMLGVLADVVSEATAHLEAYEYNRALELTEVFFWRYCDDYLELVKDRAYGDDAGTDSVRAALSLAQGTLLRLFAPFLTFVTEEVWSWWRPGSVHRQPWPRWEELLPPGVDSGASAAVLDAVGVVLSEVRKAKSEQRRSQRSPVLRLVVEDTPEQLAELRKGEDDLRRAGSIRELVLAEAASRRVQVELEPVVAEPS
jgi:valyl-tRNA synthetase